MALRKEPERRYASVEQFSEDLRRYMEGYPVAAQARYAADIGPGSSPAGTRYRCSGGAGPAHAGRRHRRHGCAKRASRIRRFNDVRKLANSYLFEFHDAIKDLPGSTPARQLVVKRGLEYLDSLAQERGNDPALARELASAYEKVGAVQGAPNYPSLGDRAGALASYRKALAIREPLAAASPQDAEIGVELSSSYQSVGELLQYAGDLNGSAAMNRKAVQIDGETGGGAAGIGSGSRLAGRAPMPSSATSREITRLPIWAMQKEPWSSFKSPGSSGNKLVAENPASREQRMLLERGLCANCGRCSRR